MTRYDIAKSRARLVRLLQKTMPAEEVIIAPDKQPPFSPEPISPIRATRFPGSAKGKIIAIGPDFNDLLADFQAYH
jgi:hypothetical protein